jgi:hypothetical protein
MEMKIVIGFLPVDRIPRDLAKAGFHYRFAFVLDPSPASQEAPFDIALYERLVEMVRTLVRAERIRIIISRKEAIEVSTTEDFHKLLVRNSENEPFSRLIFLRNGSAVAAMASEPWAHVGGPHPYHDTFTLALLTSTDFADRLLEHTRTYAAALGAKITEVVHGEAVGRVHGILDNFKRIMGWT